MKKQNIRIENLGSGGPVGRAGHLMIEGLSVQILASIVHDGVSLGKKLNLKWLPMALAAPCMAAA